MLLEVNDFFITKEAWKSAVTKLHDEQLHLHKYTVSFFLG